MSGSTKGRELGASKDPAHTPDIFLTGLTKGIYWMLGDR